MKPLYKESSQLILIACIGLVGLFESIRPLLSPEEVESNSKQMSWSPKESSRVADYRLMKVVQVKQEQAQLGSSMNEAGIEMKADSLDMGMN
ncbi:MAG: hypothetical protein ABIV51_14470 [Saprospiraceae bacterium]